MDNSLPKVRFSERGEVTAREAVGVTYRSKDADVYVLHPLGGRIYTHVGIRKEAASEIAENLRDVLVAWAELR